MNEKEKTKMAELKKLLKELKKSEDALRVALEEYHKRDKED